jgi:ketosteroid isomerase-like protein
MSQESVEVVRRARAPADGKDLVAQFRETVQRLGPDPQREAVLALSAEDPFLRHVHPDIEWDTSATGSIGTVARGLEEVVHWWQGWVQAWESYVFRSTGEYRDLGEWVLAPVDVTAQGRGGIPVEVRVFELYRVRDGKIAAYRSFLSEQQPLAACGLSHPAPQGGETPDPRA